MTEPAKVMRVAVLADTHLRPGSARRLPEDVWALLADVDVILHAGDVLTADLLDELNRFAPVHAVLGNNDHSLVGVLPETLELPLGGVQVGMIHDSGASKGRAARMHRRFPTCDVVVFGHSHLPVDEPGSGQQRLFNPGSPTERRRAPTKTMGLLQLDRGRMIGHDIVEV